MYIYIYVFNTYPLSNFFLNFDYAFPYASAYPFPFPCNIGVTKKIVLTFNPHSYLYSLSVSQLHQRRGESNY